MTSPEDGLTAKMAALRALQEIIERLRGPGGCPWDREQTLASMAPNILEEACETVDAIRQGGGKPTPEALEELGDLLMNVFLAARIAEESGGFGLREVAEAISAKLIRRHPHVFGEERAASVDDVLRGGRPSRPRRRPWPGEGLRPGGRSPLAHRPPAAELPRSPRRP